MYLNLDRQRLYFLSKIIVVIVSFLALLIGIFTFRYTRSGEMIRITENNCSNYDSKDPNSGYYECVGRGIEQMNSDNRTWMISFAIALGLPIIFFGLSYLYIYLFPKDE